MSKEKHPRKSILEEYIFRNKKLKGRQ